MLVLTRKVNEKIIIGNNQEIVAKVLRIRGGKVRIGIEAPKQVRVYREEVLKQTHGGEAE